MKKRHTIIATHGTLASGFASALNIIVGELKDTTIICGYTSADFDLDHTIEQTMGSIDFDTTEVVVFTDLFGGSINNGFTKALSKYPFQLFTNTTLGELMDYFITDPDLIDFKQKIKTNEFNIIDCNAYVASMNDDLNEDL